MGYVDKSLMPGEKVTARGKLHWWIYARPATFLVLGLMVLALPVVSVPFLVVGFFDLIRAWLERMSTELAVTDRRVIAKTGFIRRSTIELGHKKVESILVDQGITGRILNFGTIRVRGSGGTDTPIPRIAAPLQFRSSALQSIESGA